MDVWYEVIRSLLPEAYQVRLLMDCRVIIVGSPHTGEIGYATEEELRGCTTIEVVRMLERQLSPLAEILDARREAS